MLNGHPEDIPLAEWQRIMDLNYFAAVRGCQHFLPKFLARGSGHLVNTASFAGLYPYAASRVPYAASKAAIISMSQNLAVYLEPQGVRVSCLIPGPGDDQYHRCDDQLDRGLPDARARRPRPGC